MGSEMCIRDSFQQRPVAELSHPKKYGFLITNPPYGERLEDKKDLPALYQPVESAASFFRAVLMDGRRQKKIFARMDFVRAAFVRDKKRSFRHNHQFKIDEIPCQVHPLRGRGLEFAAEVVGKTGGIWK